MDLIISFIQQTLSSIGPFILLLGLLIFVHELGHFLVAKWCGVKVEVFSLGFGKKLLQYKYGDTNYCISMIPLGGYVKMYGESLQADVSPEERNKSFIHKPVGQRIAIVLAGPLMNLFFAFFLFVCIGFVGDRQPAAVIGDLTAETTAYEVGFRSGDRILEINGLAVQGWTEVSEKISAAPDQNLSFLVARGEETHTIEATPKIGPNENIFSRSSQVGRIEGLSFEANSPLIGVPDVNSKAFQAGLRSLDLVTHVNDEPVATFRDLEKKLAASSGPIHLKVQSFIDAKRGEVREIVLDSGASPAELGLEFAETYVLRVKEDSPAGRAGLLPGDKIVSVKGHAASSWTNILNAIKTFDPNSEKSVQVHALRNSENIEFELVPEMTQLMTEKGQEENRFTIGIVSSNLKVGPETIFFRPDGLINKFNYGIEQTWMWTEFTVMSMVRLFQGMVSPKNIGGVITIGRVANHSYDAGLSVFLKTMAIISINLFLLNLLPVPVLDGGHLVFFGLEAIKGSPVSIRKLEIAQQVGLFVLLLLMAFALMNDVTNLFSNRW